MSGCDHDWTRPDTVLDPVFVIDDWQGATDAIIRCAACGRFALLRMLHWSGRNLATRIYAVAGLDDQAVSVFLRNMNSAYCDLSRHGAETDMLIATATAATGGVIAEVPELRILAPLDVSELGDAKIISWRNRAPAENDPHWLKLLAAHGVGVRAADSRAPSAHGVQEQ